jgi:hypothetical protein
MLTNYKKLLNHRSDNVLYETRYYTINEVTGYISTVTGTYENIYFRIHGNMYPVEDLAEMNAAKTAYKELVLLYEHNKKINKIFF